MTTPHASPDDLPPDGACAGRWAEPLMLRDLEALGRLRDIGMEIAEAMAAQVKTAPDATPDPAPAFTGDPAASFNRLSRAVRLTVALRGRLIDDLERLNELQGRRSAHRDTERRAERKAQVARVLTNIIHDETAAAESDAPENAESEGADGRESESEACERLVREASERLRDEDRYGDVLTRPVSDFIDRICRDLGLSPDWPRLAEEAWAREELGSGRVGAPLAPFQRPAPWMGEARSRQRRASG